MSPNTNGQGAASLPFESPTLDPELEENTVNTIRMLALDAVQAANSGHAGLPMGMATAALTLWRRHLRYNPANPDWHNRDRFILSAGHGSMLLYSMLHLTGFDLPLQELKNFRQYGSMTPGHPEYGHAPGVETTTGPLGQGFANGVGMAIAEQWLAANFNRPGLDVVSHHIYAIVSDGDLMEGVAQEAASLAGPPAPRQTDLSLRRQPRHHRRLHRSGLHREPVPALRSLRLARPQSRRHGRRRR